MQLSKTDTVETPVSQKYFYTHGLLHMHMYSRMYYVHILIDILEKVFLMKIFNTVIYLFGSPSLR